MIEGVSSTRVKIDKREDEMGDWKRRKEEKKASRNVGSWRLGKWKRKWERKREREKDRIGVEESVCGREAMEKKRGVLGLRRCGMVMFGMDVKGRGEFENEPQYSVLSVVVEAHMKERKICNITCIIWSSRSSSGLAALAKGHAPTKPTRAPPVAKKQDHHQSAQRDGA